LNTNQTSLRDAYKKLFAICRGNEAIRTGNYFDLNFDNKRNISAGYDPDKLFTYLRYTPNQAILVVANFEQTHGTNACIKIPQEAWDAMKLSTGDYYTLTDLYLTDTKIGFYAPNTVERRMSLSGVRMTLAANTIYIFEIKKAEPPAEPEHR
jgi:hypothetical protein